MKINNKKYCIKGSFEFSELKKTEQFKNTFKLLKDECDGYYDFYYYYVNENGILEHQTTKSELIEKTDFEEISIDELKRICMENHKIIGYTYPESFYGGSIPVNELWIKIGENGTWYYPKCDEKRDMFDKRGIPKEIVEKYFTPVYEKQIPKLPKIGVYEGELIKTSTKIIGAKYGCKKYTLPQIEEIIESLEKYSFDSIKIEGNEINLKTIKEIHKLLKEYDGQ